MNDVHRGIASSAFRYTVLEFITTTVRDLREDVLKATNGVVGDVFDELDFRIEALISIRDMLTEYIANNRSSRNYYQPIEQLPPETLSYIFQIVLDDEASATYYTQLHKMMWVSKRWRNVADQAAALWSRVSSSYSPSLLDMILRKSGALPLHVICHHDSLNTNQHDPFLEQVTRHVGRWKVADIHPMGLVIPRPMLSTPANQLEVLRIFRPFPPRIDEANSSLFGGEAPQLREVQLSGSGCSRWITSPVLSNLTCLLLLQTGAAQLTASDYIRTIQRCPNLERLEISQEVDIDSTMERGDLFVPDNLQALERLERLHLFAPRALILLFLDSFWTPACTKFIIRCMDTGTLLGPQLAKHALRMLRSIPSYGIIDIAERLDISISRVDDEYHDEFYVNCTLPNSAAGLEWFGAVLERTEGLNLDPFLEVRVGSHRRFEDVHRNKTLVNLITGIRHINELTVATDHPNVVPLLTALTEPVVTPSAGGTAHWPLPYLEILTLPGGGPAGQAILGMVRARYGKTKISGVKRKVLPEHFNSLKISGLAANVTTKLEAIVGAGSLTVTAR